MSDLITPSTLPGFIELPPQDQIIFDKMYRILEDTYRLFGFFPIDTPVLEKSEIMLAKAGGETEKQIYRFNKGETDITMRFDLTVPLAKYVAKNYSQLVFPFKRYQIGKVYRGERAQRGRFREFYQADIDIIGNGSLSIINDAEIPSIIYTAFKKLGLDDFVIRINNRKILNGIFEQFSITDKSVEVLRIIDKIDKISKEFVIKDLIDIGIEEETAIIIINLLCNNKSTEDMLCELNKFGNKNDALELGISELKAVLFYIEKFGVPKEYYRIDLTIARGLDYYTGTVYETTLKSHPEIGSICSGGRYDNLAEYYTSQKLPGVGMSIGLSRLFYILSEKKYLNLNLSNPSDVLIIPMTEDLFKAVEISRVLRENNIRVQIFSEKKKFKNMISYANKLSIPYVIFLGEDELRKNCVSLKNMTNGDQEILSLTKAIEVIKYELNNKKNSCIILRT